MNKKAYGLLGICTAGGLAGAAVYLRYRKDLAAARERVEEGSRIIETERGPIEYGTAGHGPPVLVIHGAGGGYDQGLLIGSMGMAEEFQVIAPSRFGYLNSPIPEDSSLDAQADAYVCLLDALEIDRVVVVAFSAGGPSGFHLARRYPERTAKLVAASAISYTDPSSAEEREREESINRAIGSDFFYWLGITFARSLLLGLFGVSREVQAGLAPTEMARVDQLLEAMLPMSRRLDGILLDQERDMPKDYPLGQIKAPTLVIHARDDSLVDYSRAQHTAERIAGAELMTLEDGGHFLAGYFDEIGERIAAFLAEPGE
jgi:2-hydroxy-6-oxonona-2,4-dienedioate hydrolase